MKTAHKIHKKNAQGTRKSIKKNKEKYIAQSIKSFSRLHRKEKLKDGSDLERGKEG